MFIDNADINIFHIPTELFPNYSSADTSVAFTSLGKSTRCIVLVSLKFEVFRDILHTS